MDPEIQRRTENRVIAEYALRDLSKPIGVSAFQITESLPQELKGSLPTVEELEAELSRIELEAKD